MRSSARELTGVEQRPAAHRRRSVDDLTRWIEDLREALTLIGERAAPRLGQTRVGLANQRLHIRGSRPQALVERGVEIASQTQVDEEPRRGQRQRHDQGEGEGQLQADRQAATHALGQLLDAAVCAQSIPGAPHGLDRAPLRTAGRSSRAGCARRRRRRSIGSRSRSPRRVRALEATSTSPGRRMNVSSNANSFAERVMSVSPRHTLRAAGSRWRSPTVSTVGRSTGPRRTSARRRASSYVNDCRPAPADRRRLALERVEPTIGPLGELDIQR